jgi:uncharacterized protein YndB with AHSA1/START domain
MGRVRFVVTREFDAPVRTVWDALVDWPSHGAWIPATTIDGEPGDPTAVGYTFTGWTGVRPIALEDRMRVTRCEWDDEASVGVCTVEKIGPLLGGTAGFTVRPVGAGTGLVWHEDVTVPYLPAFLAPIAEFAGRLGFGLALRSFAKHLRATAHL